MSSPYRFIAIGVGFVFILDSVCGDLEAEFGRVITYDNFEHYKVSVCELKWVNEYKMFELFGGVSSLSLSAFGSVVNEQVVRARVSRVAQSSGVRAEYAADSGAQ